MRLLYVDNFRGFSDTFIPIKAVNFFVGENSTGKTSILGLIKLLSSPRFWFNLSFDLEEINFGHFKEIVSATSENKNYFKIGYIESEEGKDDTASMFIFVEKQGLPFLSKHYYYKNGKAIVLKFGDKHAYLNKKTFVQEEGCNHAILDIFRSWIHESLDDRRGFRKINVKHKYVRNNLFILLRNLLLGEKEIRDDEIVLDPEIPAIGNDMVWFAPIRSRPKRTYDEYKLKYSPEGDHTPYLIKYLLSKDKRDEFTKYVERFGKRSGLFESVIVTNYGKSVTSPFELDVVINGIPLSINNVGYGVSQSMPVIVELFARPKRTGFAIQQPEVHLHPRAQAALGDIIFDLSIKDEKMFFIETHTDFMIDRFLLNFPKSKEIPDSQIIFFKRSKLGNVAYPLSISHDGELPVDQPKEYREFFIKEEIRRLGV